MKRTKATAAATLLLLSLALGNGAKTLPTVAEVTTPAAVTAQA